jgi:hypothetical protein
MLTFLPGSDVTADVRDDFFACVSKVSAVNQGGQTQGGDRVLGIEKFQL